MDKKRLLLVGGLAVVAIVGFLQLQKLSQPAPVQVVTQAPAPQVISQVDYVDVLSASVDIPKGSRVGFDMMMWKKWPAEALSDNFIDINSRPQALDELIGAVARESLYMGEPVIERKLVKSGERGQMAALLEPGMRALSTRISVDTAAGGFIQPGDRVDVVLTTQERGAAIPGGGAGATNTFVATTIFANVKVLAIDQIFGNNEAGQAFVVGSTATVELSQDDAELLIEAQSKGELSLTLRGLDARKPGFVPSAATTDRKEKTGPVSSMKVYRNGQSQQVAIQGQ